MTPDDLIIFPVIMAGGSGTRLWPLSRLQAPKQLVKISGKTSFFQETIQRLPPMLCLDNVRVVCGKEHYDVSSEHLSGVGLATKMRIIVEPVGRNTAPAVLLAVLKILEQSSIQDALFFILPADHVIGDVARFHERIGKAVDLAHKGYLVTFGIQPGYPETGYGYIEGGTPVSGDGLAIERFVEKPDAETARSYIAAGNFFWNSGMFAFRASTILEAYEQFAPDMLAKMKIIVKKGGPISGEAYQELPSISFDVAIMEKTSRGVVLPSEFGWSDIGTWNSLYDYMPKDDDGNVIAGDVIACNTRNSLIIAESRLVAANDISGGAIVETPDAVFVSSLETSRNAQDIVSILKKRHRREYRAHLLENHAWGSIQYLEKSATLFVAKLRIKPNAAYKKKLRLPGRWHICLLAGEARIGHAETQHELRAGNCLSLDVQSEVIVKNSGNNMLLAIMTHS